MSKEQRANGKMLDFKWLNRRREVPDEVVGASHLVGIENGSDRAWHFVGTYPVPKKWAVECPCAVLAPAPWIKEVLPENHQVPPITLTPLVISHGQQRYTVYLIGQCSECDLILWATVPEYFPK